VPIQVNYIGFPGTLGAGFYDYIIGDARIAAGCATRTPAAVHDSAGAMGLCHFQNSGQEDWVPR